MNTPRIFISYSRSDQDWASELAKSMVDKGIDVFFDQKLPAGASYHAIEEEALRKSDALVLLITRESLGLPNYLFFELGAAFGLNKKIIPIVSEDVDPKSLPIPLSRIKFLRRSSPAETAGELAAEIALLNGEAA